MLCILYILNNSIPEAGHLRRHTSAHRRQNPWQGGLGSISIPFSYNFNTILIHFFNFFHRSHKKSKKNLYFSPGREL